MKERIANLKNKLIALKFIRFLISGGTAFLIDTAILISIKAIIFGGVDVKLLGTISVAKLVSGTVGIIFMFVLSRSWVFADAKESSIKKQTVKYLLYTGLNLIFASILYTFFSVLLSQIFPEQIIVHATIFIAFSNLLTEGTKMVVSFFAYKYLVFR
ncbi:MAG: GtrA family protein [Candidatus Dojkabacteria bacterium]